MCGWGPYAREASVWEACCRYSGVINMFLNCPCVMHRHGADQTEPAAVGMLAGPVASNVCGNVLALVLSLLTLSRIDHSMFAFIP